MNNSHQYHTSTSAAVGADSTTNFRSSGVSACLGQDSCQLHNQKAMQMWGTRAVRADSTTNFRSSGVSACLGQDSCQLQNQKAMQMLGTRTVKHFMEQREQRPQEVHQQEDESMDPYDLDPQTEHLLKNVSQTSSFNRTTNMQMQISASELNVDQDVAMEESVLHGGQQQLPERNISKISSCSSTFEDNLNWLSNGSLTASPLTHLPERKISKFSSKDWISNGSLTAPPLSKSDREFFDADFDQMKPSLQNFMVNGAEEEAKRIAEAEAKAKAEAEKEAERIAAEAETKAKAKEEARLAAEEEARAKAEAEEEAKRIAAVVATDLDVLSGRGAMTNAHPGNIRYRQLIEDYKPEYAALTSKHKKCAFTVRIMEEIKGYGGRFLTKACVKGPWVVKKPNAARKKISQSLRE